MRETRGSGVISRWQRRWSFADCLFDEANWSLFVGGRRVALETKPLLVLRELLERPGDLVSKQDLLDAVWPGVAVVEASLPTAVAKLRRAFDDHKRQTPIIETVSKIGYRLTVPVDMSEDPPAVSRDMAETCSTRAPPEEHAPRPSESVAGSRRIAAGVFAGLALVAGVAASPMLQRPLLRQPAGISQREAANALRRLDIPAIEGMLAAGWDPNTPFDGEGNGAINHALNMCEWDRRHDQRKLLLLIRTLIDGGARLDQRNIWGDTPYSIAKAERYCGPDHPVTESLHTMCYAGYRALGDRCLATYELARRTG